MTEATVIFKVNFESVPGEDLYVDIINVPALPSPVPLKYQKNCWEGQVKVSSDDLKALSFTYVVKSAGTFGRRSTVRSYKTKSAPGAIVIRDFWRKNFQSGVPVVFLSSLFKDCIYRPSDRFAGDNQVVTASDSNFVVRLQVTVPVMPDTNRRVYVTGSCPAIGNWDIKNAIPCTAEPDSGVWFCDIKLSKNNLPFQYKFILGTDDRKDVMWEADPNRNLTVDHLNELEKDSAGAEQAALVLQEEPFHYPRGFGFKGAGVAIPVFSLRSEKSLGCGEFLDLKLMADWTSASGLSVIQILPVNDTIAYHDWRDASPYSGVSVFALHPIYINLQAIGNLPQSVIDAIPKEKARLEKAKLEYSDVVRTKLELLREIFASQKAEFQKDLGFKKFYETSKQWLAPYAVFCALRDKYQTAEFPKWPEFSKPAFEDVYRIAEDGTLDKDTIYFWYFVQYHLHLQLLEASNYSKSKRVGLKGDLPIGVRRFCVDTWIYPQSFDMRFSTGAPSDPGCFWGQNWDLPVYNWDQMARDGYAWWKARMQNMSVYFHAFRVDHVLGFFRVWQVPEHCVKGIMGTFNPCNPVWKRELEGMGAWDVNRLCEPYIRRQHVYDRFGGRGSDIINRFFDGAGGDRLRFKQEYNTEKKIKAALQPAMNANEGEKKFAQQTMEGLWGLLDSVVMIRDPFGNGEAFHPRMRITDSPSFHELPDGWKGPLISMLDNYIWHRQDDKWAQMAMRTLPMMKNSSEMMVCAEDLGMIPKCLPGILDKLQILGLRVQRFPTGPEEFAHPGSYPYWTVCTTSTHDIPPVRSWWEQLDGGKRSRFFGQIKCGGNPPGFCEPWIAEKIVAQHLESNSVWAIFPFQDLMACKSEIRRSGHPGDEQVNFPELGEHENNWRFRLHCNMEDILKNKDFAAQIRGLVQSRGRAH